jgi:hypothetical protein
MNGVGGKNEWTFAANGGASASANLGAGSTKIGEFIYRRVGTVNITAASQFDTSGDGISTHATTVPTTATTFVTCTGGSLVVIDPKSRVLYTGDSQTFADTSRDFLTNTFYWIAYASQYGSSFSDLLIENGQPGSMPAPWDDAWGANKIERFQSYNY